jgi:hypothetical protein
MQLVHPQRSIRRETFVDTRVQSAGLPEPQARQSRMVL